MYRRLFLFFVFELKETKSEVNKNVYVRLCNVLTSLMNLGHGLCSRADLVLNNKLYRRAYHGNVTFIFSFPAMLYMYTLTCYYLKKN